MVEGEDPHRRRQPPSAGDDRGAGRVERVVELRRVAPAGLGGVVATATAAADHGGGLADERLRGQPLSTTPLLSSATSATLPSVGAAEDDGRLAELVADLRRRAPSARR